MVTQATGPSPQVAAHEATAIVLPAPGGPVITVSGPRAPSAIRRSIRLRGTTQPGTLGGASLDVSNGSSARGACRRLGARACSSELIPSDLRTREEVCRGILRPLVGLQPVLGGSPSPGPLLQADPLFKLSGNRVIRLHPPRYLTRVRLVAPVVREPGRRVRRPGPAALACATGAP